MLNAGRLVLLGDGILDTLHLRARNETEGIVVCIDAIADFIRPRAVLFSPGASGGLFQLVLELLELSLYVVEFSIVQLENSTRSLDIFRLIRAGVVLSFDFGVEMSSLKVRVNSALIDPMASLNARDPESC